MRRPLVWTVLLVQIVLSACFTTSIRNRTQSLVNRISEFGLSSNTTATENEISNSTNPEDQNRILVIRPPIIRPTCNKNEKLYSCLPGCAITCDNIDRSCVSRPSVCRSGCECRSGFARPFPRGPCIPLSQCPSPKCDDNEVWLNCGRQCDEECEQRSCRESCRKGCYCKQGYSRINGRCEKSTKCPVICHENEYKKIVCKKCNPFFGPCQTECREVCTCRNGFIKINNKCKCRSGFHSKGGECVCPDGEVNIGGHCESDISCTNGQIEILPHGCQNDDCEIQICKCHDGFLLNNDKCECSTDEILVNGQCELKIPCKDGEIVLKSTNCVGTYCKKEQFCQCKNNFEYVRSVCQPQCISSNQLLLTKPKGCRGNQCYYRECKCLNGFAMSSNGLCVCEGSGMRIRDSGKCLRDTDIDDHIFVLPIPAGCVGYDCISTLSICLDGFTMTTAGICTCTGTNIVQNDKCIPNPCKNGFTLTSDNKCVCKSSRIVDSNGMCIPNQCKKDSVFDNSCVCAGNDLVVKNGKCVQYDCNKANEIKIEPPMGCTTSDCMNVLCNCTNGFTMSDNEGCVCSDPDKVIKDKKCVYKQCAKNTPFPADNKCLCIRDGLVVKNGKCVKDICKGPNEMITESPKGCANSECTTAFCNCTVGFKMSERNGCICSDSEMVLKNGKCVPKLCEKNTIFNDASKCVCGGKDLVVKNGKCVEDKCTGQKETRNPKHIECNDHQCDTSTVLCECSDGFKMSDRNGCICSDPDKILKNGKCVPKLCEKNTIFNDASKCVCGGKDLVVKNGKCVEDKCTGQKETRNPKHIECNDHHCDTSTVLCECSDGFKMSDRNGCICSDPDKILKNGKCVPKLCEKNTIFNDASKCVCGGKDLVVKNGKCVEDKCTGQKETRNPKHIECNDHHCDTSTVLCECSDGFKMSERNGCICSDSEMVLKNGKCVPKLCEKNTIFNDASKCVCGGKDLVVKNGKCVEDKCTGQKETRNPKHLECNDHHCDTSTVLCECSDGFKMSEDNKCICADSKMVLKGNVCVPKQCAKNTQFSSRNTCECIGDGLIYKNDICIEDDCDQPHHVITYEPMGCKGSKCTNAFCNCTEGFKMSEDKKCICADSKMVLKGNVCVPKQCAKNTQFSSRNTCECIGDGLIYKNDICIEDDCDQPHHVITYEPMGCKGSKCTNAFCNCAEGFKMSEDNKCICADSKMVLKGNVCVPKQCAKNTKFSSRNTCECIGDGLIYKNDICIEDDCDQPHHVITYEPMGCKGSKCTNAFCNCAEGFKMSEDNKCICADSKIVLKGNVCVPKQCAKNTQFSSRNTCECIGDGLIYKNDICIEDDCDQPHHVITYEPMGCKGSKCTNAFCNCAEGFKMSEDNKCICADSKMVLKGNVCVPKQCAKNTQFSSRNTCECIGDGLIYKNDICIEDDCDQPHHVITYEPMGCKGSKCTNAFCNCAEGFKMSEDNKCICADSKMVLKGNVCVPKQCAKNTQFSSRNTCECIGDGLIYKNDICIEDDCDQPHHVITYEPMGCKGSKCTNAFCNCTEGFKMSEDNKCICADSKMVLKGNVCLPKQCAKNTQFSSRNTCECIGDGLIYKNDICIEDDCDQPHHVITYEPMGCKGSKCTNAFCNCTEGFKMSEDKKCICADSKMVLKGNVCVPKQCAKNTQFSSRNTCECIGDGLIYKNDICIEDDCDQPHHVITYEPMGCKGSKCTNAFCNCAEGFKMSEDNKCICADSKMVLKGNVCVPKQCAKNTQFSSRNTCECIGDGLIYKNDICIEDDCDQPHHVITYEPMGCKGSKCTNAFCNCTEGFKMSEDNKCICADSKMVLKGNVCLPKQCAKNTQFSSRNTCECIGDGLIYKNDICIEDDCDQPHHVITYEPMGCKGSKCTNAFCNCTEGFKMSEDNKCICADSKMVLKGNVCVPKQCAKNTQFSSRNTCECIGDGLIYKNDICIEDDCDQPHHVITYEPMGCKGSKCTNAFCNCAEGFKMSEDNKCICADSKMVLKGNVCVPKQCAKNTQFSSRNTCECIGDGLIYKNDICIEDDCDQPHHVITYEPMGCKGSKCTNAFCNCAEGFKMSEDNKCICADSKMVLKGNVCVPKQCAKNTQFSSRNTCECIGDGLIYKNDICIEDDCDQPHHVITYEPMGCKGSKCTNAFCNCTEGFKMSEDNKCICADPDMVLKGNVCVPKQCAKNTKYDMNSKCVCADGLVVKNGKCVEDICGPNEMKKIGQQGCNGPNCLTEFCECKEGFSLSSKNTCVCVGTEKVIKNGQCIKNECKGLYEMKTTNKTDCMGNNCNTAWCECKKGFFMASDNTCVCDSSNIIVDSECISYNCKGEFDNIGSSPSGCSGMQCSLKTCQCNEGFTRNNNNVCECLSKYGKYIRNGKCSTKACTANENSIKIPEGCKNQNCTGIRCECANKYQYSSNDECTYKPVNVK